MKNLKILIVDDEAANRHLLNELCESMGLFEVKEAQDGHEAIEITQQWHPHIILMDLLMPGMDGIQASKTIKEQYPETMVIAITAMNDPQLEKDLASIGVVIYIHKPFDKALIQFKLESFGALLRAKEGSYKSLSSHKAINPFSADIRRLKTTFNITDSDSTMDFGMWILSKVAISCYRIDMALEFFYTLIREYCCKKNMLHIVIEESFDELFVTIESEKVYDFQYHILSLAHNLGDMCIIDEKFVYMRMPIQDHCIIPNYGVKTLEKKGFPAPVAPPVAPKIESVEPVAAPEPLKEVRVVIGQEKDLLRQSFTDKTSAWDYVRDIGGDVMDEIRDLESLSEEWRERLVTLESDPIEDNITYFSEKVLNVYVHAINNLFEFTALAYALSALSSTLKEHAETLIGDSAKLKKSIMLLEHLGEDLVAWREHIFLLQDTADIHYLDSSFFSSCMQIEGIVSNKVVQSDDDDEMEFF